MLLVGLGQAISFTFTSFSLQRLLQKPKLHRRQMFDLQDLEVEEPPARKLDVLMKDTFDNLKNENNKLRYKDFVNFKGIQRMFSENLMQPSDLEQIWKRRVDAELKPADYDDFLKLNDGINELFGESMEALDNPDEFESAWNENRAIEPRFVGNTVEYLREFFDSVAFVATATVPKPPSLSPMFDDAASGSAEEGEVKLITFKSFADWDEISVLLRSGDLEPHFVKDLWQEALEYRYRYSPSEEHIKDSRHSILSEQMLMKISGKEMYSCTDTEYCIDFDTFLRMNYRLDEIVADSNSEAERDLDAQYDALYKKEFNRVTSHAKLMTFEQLLQWDKMQQMLANEAITIEHLHDLWLAVPKQFIPLEGNLVKFAPTDDSTTEAIDLMSFIAINNEIQDSLLPDDE